MQKVPMFGIMLGLEWNLRQSIMRQTPIVLELIGNCFKKLEGEWQAKLKQMIPSYGLSFLQNPELCEKTLERTSEILGLNLSLPLAKKD